MALKPLSTLVGHAQRIGENYGRVAAGLEPLARDHLPFGRRERIIDKTARGRIRDVAKKEGLSPYQLHNFDRYLFDLARRPDPNDEEFILTFLASRAAAKQVVFEQCWSPHVAWDVYGEIVAAIGRRTGRSQITRDELAQLCRVRPDQISRHTQQLCNTNPPLLRRHDEGRRGVWYEVLVPSKGGFPTWKGDRGSRLDAMGRQQLAEAV